MKQEEDPVNQRLHHHPEACTFKKVGAVDQHLRRHLTLDGNKLIFLPEHHPFEYPSLLDSTTSEESRTRG